MNQNFSQQTGYPYSVMIEGGTLYQAGRSLSDIYEYLKYACTDGNTDIKYTCESGAVGSGFITELEGQEYITAQSGYAVTKASPFGTFAGGTFFGAQGVWLAGMTGTDANNIQLTDANGTWGSYARFDKVLTFLENRPLNEQGYPFQFYDATTGREYYPESNASTNIVDVADTGRLFVALNNLRNLNNSLAPRINNIVLNGRSDYAALVASIESDSSSNSIYAYYYDSGFASFWPQQLGTVPSTILSNILNSQEITTYGVSLPNAPLCTEPLLSSVFELDNGDRPRLMSLMSQVYLACEAYSKTTLEYMAPSEGSNSSAWVYEWVVAPNGEPWRITDYAGNLCENRHSIVYNKVAFSFLALFKTSYARNMVVWLEDALPDPVNGYYAGLDNYGGIYLSLSNIGNTLILDAALYALHEEA